MDERVQSRFRRVAGLLFKEEQGSDDPINVCCRISMNRQSFSPVLLTFLCLAALACGGDPETSQVHVVQRLLPETGELFAAERLESKELVFEWQFRNERDWQPWSAKGFSLGPNVERGRLIFGYKELGAVLERTVDWQADDIDLLEIEVPGTERGPLRLRWAAAGQNFEADHVLQRPPDPHRNPTTYIFDLRHHAGWKGEIRALRLLPRLRPRTKIQMTAIRGYRVDWRDEVLASAQARSWKVELGDETRTARMMPLGTTRTESLEVPSEGRLTASYAAAVRLGKPVELELALRHGEGLTSLHRATVMPKAMMDDAPAKDGQEARMAGRWHDVEVDLSPWAGETVELVLSALGDDPAPGEVAFWGDLHVSAASAEKRLPDVALIIIDTLRADHLSLYGYERPTTPRIDAWAKQRATVFESAVAASSWTYPSHISLFTGLDTLGHGQHNPRPIPERFELLAETLQAQGYRTLAATGGGYVDPHYGFAAGFDRYYSYPGDKKGIGDLTPVLETTKRWLKDEERPVFLFLHTYEVHSPYRIREPYYEQLTGAPGDPELAKALTPIHAEKGKTVGALHRKAYGWRHNDAAAVPLKDEEHQVVRDIYDASLAYADHHLGDFLEAFEARAGEPLVVITSDHGEALGEQGMAEHSYLLDFNLMIPLIMRLPEGRGAGGRVETQVRQIDVKPTVLEALELTSRQAMDGASLLPLIDDPSTNFSEPAWSATSLQGISFRKDNRFKYIFNNTMNHRQYLESLFMLREDPDELQDLSAERPTDDLRQMLVERYQSQFTGLLVTLENGGRTAQTLSIAGPLWITGQYFKTVDAPPGALQLPTAGRLQATVEPGQRFSFVAEQVSPATGLQVTLEGGGRSCELQLASGGSDDSSEEAADSHPLMFDGACQSLAANGGADTDGFRAGFFFSRSVQGLEATDDALPSALRDQLEALGYLD